MESALEIQANMGEWQSCNVQLTSKGLLIDGEASFFRAETRISIPMRNLKREAQFKGCAFQVESGEEIKTFMASSLAEKNAWARKLNIVLGELRASGEYEATGENAPPAEAEETPEKACFSADRQQRQKAAVQQLAQSLQPRRTMGRTDRSGEMAELERALAGREKELAEREKELSEANSRLAREVQYREQITAGIEKWRQDTARQQGQKLQDTRERLEEEVQRGAGLERERARQEEEAARAGARVRELEERVRGLEEEMESGGGLRREVAELRSRLAKEAEFVQVLERDTQQMAEELVRLSSAHAALQQQHEADSEAYRSQSTELRQELAARAAEATQLRQENARLLAAQAAMHREFFFSLALSIKLSLAGQGIYSNADLNLLYEAVLSEPCASWTRIIEQRLSASQLQTKEDHKKSPAAAAAPAPTPKKTGFRFFN